MSLHQKDSGTRVTAANIGDVTDAVTDSDPYVEVLEDLYERTEFEGGDDATAATGDDKQTKAFHEGQIVRESELLAKMTPLVIDGVDNFAPRTALATAGGTVINVTDVEGADGITAVTVGGTAATAVAVDDSTAFHFTTPAKAAGTYNVVVSDDAGAVTVVGALVFA